jgi:glutaredoxin
MTKLTLIKRSQPRCPGCEMMKVVLDGEGVEHEVIDITETPEAINEYEISGVPVLLFKDDNGLTTKLTGVQPIEKVKELLV